MTDVGRVAVADAQPLLRKALRDLVEAEPGLEWVGEASDVEELFAVLESGATPDVLVLDLEIPGGVGIEIVGQLHERHPDVGILVLTALPEDAFLPRAIRAGASGYLEKDRDPGAIVEAIQEIAAGGSYVSERGSRILTDAMRPGRTGADHTILSDREFEVLRRLASGATVTEIAAELGLSPKTVSTYRSRLLEKMGFSGNRDIVRYAIGHGLVE